MILTAEEIEAVRQQAEAEYPNECCGVVMARGDERRLLRFRNIQDEMHRMDPKRFPRTGANAYYVGKEDHDRMDALARGGFDLAVIYHSHPDVGAYFSPTDRQQAAPPPLGEPIWVGATYVVFAINGGRAEELAAFRWDAEARDFVEVHRARVTQSAKAAR
ncbi:MAG: Mov34/MPN/PAD-1 family protein [Candidatus Rokuibacteriota bacterium]